MSVPDTVLEPVCILSPDPLTLNCPAAGAETVPCNGDIPSNTAIVVPEPANPTGVPVMSPTNVCTSLVSIGVIGSDPANDLANDWVVGNKNDVPF